MCELRIWKDLFKKAIVVAVLMGVCTLAFYFLGVEEVLQSNEGDDVEFWRHRTPPSANSHVIENSCKWPVINDVINNFAKGRKRIISDICEYEWLMRSELDVNSTLTLDVVEGHSDLLNSTNCFYTKLSENGTHEQKLQFDWLQTVTVPDPIFHIRCESNNRTVFEKTFHNWESFVESDNSKTEYSDEEPVSVSLIALPSIGSLQFASLLPKTSDFMKTENFISMKMFNQISDNSIENLLHLMNGPNEESLIEIAEARGCITITNEDSQIYNVTAAFKDEAQINFKKYFNWNKTKDDICNKNGLTIYEEFLKNFRSSAFIRNSKCVSSFNYFSQFPYLTDMEISHFDSALRITLETMKLNPLYDRMVFVIVGVNSVTGMEKTMAEAILSRNPLLAIKIPDSYRERNVIPSYNVELNAMRLTTSFDVYETIKTFLDSNQTSKESAKGFSLLSREFSTQSTCSSKEIPRHLCLCMIEDTEQSNEFYERSEKYNQTFGLVERVLTQLSCVRNISFETEEFGNNARIYALSSNILSQISRADDLFEYIEIGYKTKTIEQSNPSMRSMRISGFARLRRRLSTNEVEVLTPVPMLIKPRFCWARDVMTVCEMCANELVLST